MTEIRPEARAVSWETLDKGQQEALTRVLKMIECSLPKKPPKQDNQHSQIPYISDDRSSRLAFLDGGRGTGKSTILITLQKIIKEGKIESSVDLPDETSSAIKSIDNRIVCLESIDMEPTPRNWNMLPAILSRFEQAYHQHCGQQGENASYDNNCTGLLEPSRHYHEVMRELRQLQNNVALSWNGNLNDRASQLDPDAYALETMRIEQARLGLNPSVERVLNSLACEINRSGDKTDPLFILPIDDFDLNPVVCLELLRILRMLSVPRLFFLMLGDLEIVDVVLNLKISNDLNFVCPNIGTEMLSIEPRNVAKAAGRIAAHSIHKLLPPMQCIQLLPMLAFEALNFSPLGELTSSDRPMLYQKLEDCEMPFGDHIYKKHWGGHPYNITTLANFLIYKGLSVVVEEHNGDANIHCKPNDNNCYSEDDIRNAFYSGINIMNTVPRNVTDIWFTFNRFVEIEKYHNKQADTEQKAKVIWEKKLGLVADLCRNILLRDGVLDPKTRSQTRGSFFDDQLGGWDFEALPIVTISVIGHEKVIQYLNNDIITNNNDPKNNKTTLHFNAFQAKGWRFQIPTNPTIKQQTEIVNESTQKHEIYGQSDDIHGIRYQQLGREFSSTDHLETDTSGALILFHDLLALSETNRSHSFLLRPGIKHVKHNAWCMTTWKRGLAQQAHLPWYRPRCRSFWGLDLFLYAWNHALDNKKLINSKHSSAMLAFVWLSAGTGVISIDKPVTISESENFSIDGLQDKWKELGEKLNKMADKFNNPELEPELASAQIQSWLISVALMIMPETGLQCSPKLYSCQKELLKFWTTHSRTISQIRYERLMLICEAEMEDLARYFYEDTPKEFNNSDIDIDIHIDQFRPHELEGAIYKDDLRIKLLNFFETENNFTIAKAVKEFGIPYEVVTRLIDSNNSKKEQ